MSAKPEDQERRIGAMKLRLESALEPSRLEIVDDSHKHVGHAGARDGRGHFTVIIEAEAFRGRGALERHRMVYDALGEMMQADIHALAIRAGTPE